MVLSVYRIGEPLVLTGKELLFQGVLVLRDEKNLSNVSSFFIISFDTPRWFSKLKPIFKII